MLYTTIVAMPPTQFPQRWVLTGLSVLLVLLALLTAFGERGVLHIWRLAEEKRKLDEANFVLQKENEGLREKIHRLRHDDLYLEKVAREELGLARPGEIVYRFAPSDTRKNAGFSRTIPERPRSSAQTARQ
jgi:cell division protein FtsB